MKFSGDIYIYKITKWDKSFARVAEEKYYWDAYKAVRAFEKISNSNFSESRFEREVDSVLGGETSVIYRTDYSYYLQEIKVVDEDEE